jgi:hypothetical protein
MIANQAVTLHKLADELRNSTHPGWWTYSIPYGLREAWAKHVEIVCQDYEDGVYDNSSQVVESLVTVAAAAGIAVKS